MPEALQQTLGVLEHRISLAYCYSGWRYFPARHHRQHGGAVAATSALQCSCGRMKATGRTLLHLRLLVFLTLLNSSFYLFLILFGRVFSLLLLAFAYLSLWLCLLVPFWACHGGKVLGCLFAVQCTRAKYIYTRSRK